MLNYIPYLQPVRSAAELWAHVKVLISSCQGTSRAGDGSRTRLNSLEGYRTTDVLRPQFCAIILS